jgi:hypothetical protein
VPGIVFFSRSFEWAKMIPVPLCAVHQIDVGEIRRRCFDRIHQIDEHRLIRRDHLRPGRALDIGGEEDLRDATRTLEGFEGLRSVKQIDRNVLIPPSTSGLRRETAITSQSSRVRRWRRRFRPTTPVAPAISAFLRSGMGRRLPFQVTKQGYSRSLFEWHQRHALEDRMFDKTHNCQGYAALLRK